MQRKPTLRSNLRVLESITARKQRSRRWRSTGGDIMRTHILTGLITLVVALAPRASQADHTTTIFADFPELSEWGHLVLIGGVEYWRPYPALVYVDWAPYKEGYLYEDPDEGLVWVSNDPWGVITEHYGYWRHHDRYGYVWRPLYPLQWHPVMSSIFRDDRDYIVGWSPFYVDVWSRGLYVVGWGFDDYYWAPFWDRVCYPSFYTYHYQRFCGWHVGVTIYDYDVYYRDEPDRCYRRDWEYRERQGHHRRERHRDPDLRSLVVRDDLKSRHRVETPTRSRESAQPASSRGTVEITPRSGNPWSPPRGERKREDRGERARNWFQPSRVSVTGESRQAQSRAAAPSVSRAALPAASTPIAVVEPERRAQPRATVTAPRPERPLEVRRTQLTVQREQPAVARPAARETSAPAQPPRLTESPAPRREAQPAAAPVRFDRPAAPAAPQVERSAAAASERVRTQFGAARKSRN